MIKIWAYLFYNLAFWTHRSDRANSNNLKNHFFILCMEAKNFCWNYLKGCKIEENYFCVFDKELEEVKRKMEEDARNVLSYMASNGLIANPKKTAMLFLNNKKSKESSAISIMIGKEMLEQEHSAKLLGIFIVIIFPFLWVSSAFNSLDGCLTNWGRLLHSNEGLVASTIWPSAADHSRVSAIGVWVFLYDSV